MSGCACMCVHMWRPEATILCHHLLFLCTLLFEAGFLTKPGVITGARLSEQQALGPSCLCTLRTGTRRLMLQCLAFTWALGIRTNVLRLELQAHHPLSHPPTLLLPLEPSVSGFMWCVLQGKTFFTMRASEIHLSCRCSFC